MSKRIYIATSFFSFFVVGVGSSTGHWLAQPSVVPAKSTISSMAVAAGAVYIYPAFPLSLVSRGMAIE